MHELSEIKKQKKVVCLSFLRPCFVLIQNVNFIQNTNRSISILFEFHTEYLFESDLYWVYSNIHVTQIAFLDWLTSS